MISNLVNQMISEWMNQKYHHKEDTATDYHKEPTVTDFSITKTNKTK